MLRGICLDANGLNGFAVVHLISCIYRLLHQSSAVALTSGPVLRAKCWIKRMLPEKWCATVASMWRAMAYPLTFDSEEPHLTVEEGRRFFQALGCCTVFLEYGSGGSTLAALKHVPIVVSVESDRRFARALACAAKRLRGGQLYLISAYIGRTGAWGEPLERSLTPPRLRQWRRYPQAPWQVLNRKQLLPDFIFVDGRFRVACTLESLLRLPPGHDCIFLFDDFYQYGDAYLAILEFVEITGRHGRAVEFRRSASFDRERCRAVLNEYYGDYR
jgi:hypothetical protein